MIAEILATAAAGMFAGAAVYINVVEQPAVLQLGPPTATRFFTPMYARAVPLQGSLALLGSLAGSAAWWSGRGWQWLAGALLLGFVNPFTLVVVRPTNDRRKDPALDSASPATAQLYQRWASLHAVRTVASSLSFLAFLFAMVRE